MADCLICVKNNDFDLKGTSKFKSKAGLNIVYRANINGDSNLNVNKNQQAALISSVVRGNFSLKASSNLSNNLDFADTVESNIKAWLKISGNAKTNLLTNSKFQNTYIDKFSGHLNDLSSLSNFIPVQKLYPIGDEITALNNSYFVNKNLSTQNLYDSLDEGVFIGNYNEHLNKSNRISDDNESFIQPSSIFTSGTFRYKCEITRPYHHPKHSFLFIRASAPLSNYGANIPPEYRIHNIKLEDPSGNIIVKYKDITLKGDADYSKDVVNYATYISEPEINNANLRTWDENYPILNEGSGYTLNLDFDVICLDDPFDQGFNRGYEEKACDLKFVNNGDNDYLAIDGAPLSTHTQGYHLNPTNTIRISAIEICNSGDLCSLCENSGIKLEDYFGFYTEVAEIGQRLSRTILPVEILQYRFDNEIYPEEYSLWESSPDYNLNVSYNTSASGSNVLVSKLRNFSNNEYITLSHNDISVDSGRLTIKFSHEKPLPSPLLRFGAFDLSSNSDFDKARPTSVNPVDNFFTIDTLELRVVAKKAVGSPDYVLDVVGYSDDKILNVTPKIGAFLQNTNIGIGAIPSISGFKNIDDLGLSSETLSDKSAYYEDYLTSIDAGDHYSLSTLPVIDSTEFVEYTIPLSIYEDRVDVGKSIDYSMSSYFENLYIDLYPIPSGASISNIRLVVNYKPSNGMMLHTLGTPNNKNLGQRDIRLLPIGWDDVALNSDIDSGSLSVISGIPQAYGEPTTLKTNYARRWRGVDGNIVNGPYNPNEFDFSYYNPEADQPFLNGYFDFNNSSGNWIISQDYSASGYYNGDKEILKNIGWRFNSEQLFDKVTNYKTLDWAENDDYLYGKISDAFDSVLELPSGKYIEFNDFVPSGGFSIFLRFTPDKISTSGTVATPLINKWLSFPNLKSTISLAIRSDNVLGCVVFDSISNSAKIYTDNKYIYDYQFPLSVLLTYSGSPSGILRLYTRNEINNSNDLCFETEPITIDNNTDFPLHIGHSIINNPNRRLFIHEIGISNSGNLVNDSPNRLFKQTTAEAFLDNHSHSFNESSYEKFKLNNYIDDDTSFWKLGDFKICAFSPDFDGFTKRIGKDYIIHHLKHSGSGYSQITNLPLPSSINASGLAYHTQIENDFLRFNLQDMPNVNPEFYSTLPRICKTLPRDYDFAERAFVVDTIIEHETNNNILWPDGSVGPKLIVSLYSKNQDPADRPSKVNWGLINRSIHYLPPSGCYEKISSTFNYNDLIDISEPWALFDLDNIRSEFDQKYYSADIDDMFLQYDLVYPSGSPFESKIKIHSANVRLENALVYWADNNNQFNLYASGEAISYADVNLFTYGFDHIDSSINLFVDGSPWNQDSGNLNFSISGIYGTPNNYFNLFVKNSGEIVQFGPDLYVDGGNPRSQSEMNLVMIDNTADQIRNQTLDFVVAGKGLQTIESSLSMFTEQLFSPVEYRKNSTMNLHLANSQVITYNASNSFNLYINTDLEIAYSSGTLGLFTTNYLSYNQAFGQKAFISWNKNNVGISIDPIKDSNVPFLEPNDEIRGVELLCFGECETSNACDEQAITLHDTEWYSELDCVDGGILRAKNTYTNLETSGFKTDIGYSGHFYGIRKYDGLVPNAPYFVTLRTQSGNDKPIVLPSQFVEMDYGSNEYVDYSGIKFTADKELGSGERDTGNKYGKSVAVKNDLIAIGAPMQELQYTEDEQTFNLKEAGAVFLYRRNPRPSGYSWPENEHKSDWVLEEKLTLPSGLLKDYPTIVTRSTIDGVGLPEPITERFWNVGQEGRQFGHSLDIGINNSLKSFEEDKREIVVVGGPSAKWDRNFQELNVSGVSVGLLIFTDEFTPTVIQQGLSNPLTYSNILRSIENKDLLFSYFSDPPVKFDVKIIICEPKSQNTNTQALDFPPPAPTFITKRVIPRNEGLSTPNQTLSIFSGIKGAFEDAFPYDPTKLNNNIPVMLGVYVDNSRSLGERAIQPALNDFLSYYEQYSFASGLTDFYNVQSSGAVYKYDSSNSLSENWISASILALNELLDTGRLVAEDQTRFFTSGVGLDYFNENLTSFNHPPSSGGRVYIFEKESGAWNLIQEIQSPIVSYDTLDRFGHAVAISEDTNIIAVGSPYINECCKVYQYNPREKDRLFSSSGLITWLNYQNSLLGGSSIRYEGLIEDYDAWLEEYGFIYANKILYSKLTATEKFQARNYLNIEEYENIFTYSYSNIPYKGEYWTFIPKTFAPSSRLGYSVSVNDDGSTIAIGAPTDSFNVFDDYNVYYKNEGYSDPLNIDLINGSIRPSWRSNVNAGAVRLLESRDYYPHNRVVEYGKFGNLQQSLNDPADSGHFGYLENIFSVNGKTFTKMTEDEIAIPEDAGLAFIITPGVDAVSDEIINSIISWLELGDRNLVLVGNDPVWEASGIYKQSNDIINKILDRLNSRMRIHPARNFAESLPSGSSLVLPSFKPENGIQTYIRSYPLQTASGVGDIRMHFPGFNSVLTCSPDDPVNSMCQMPISHNGDLRAQWYGYCYRGDPARLSIYPINWAFQFRTFIPGQCLDDGKEFFEGTINLPDRDVVPLLAAAGFQEKTRNLPAIPPSYAYETLFEERFSTTPSQAEFVNSQLFSEPAFVWNSGNNGYSSYLSNINNAIDNDQWFTPSVFQNRQAVLQAEASSDTEIVLGSKVVQNVLNYCVEENFGSSKIIGIAGVRTESQSVLYSGQGDKNIDFYVNMVAKNQNGGARIVQLGGWTGRKSFTEGYSESILKEVFNNSGNSVIENVTQLTYLSGGTLSSDYDVCWITNPINLPNQQQLDQLINWLNIGNKKLIISHDNSVAQIILVSKLFSMLNSKIKPLYLPVRDLYPILSVNGLIINPLHPIAIGFGVYPIDFFDHRFEFVTFEDSNEITKIAYFNQQVSDSEVLDIDYLKINTGVDKISFPVLPGSGYKLFVDYVSENITEILPINVYFSNSATVPGLPFPNLGVQTRTEFIVDPKNSDEVFRIDRVSHRETLSAPAQNTIFTKSINLQIEDGKNELDIYINSLTPRLLDYEFLPKTTRILSISGVLLPITQPPPNRTSYLVPTGVKQILISEGSPSQQITERVAGVIQSFNDKYCTNNDCEEYGWSGKLIADGPVVAAQEIEFISNNNAGSARSRITLIADSNLVQGRYMVDEFGRMSAETVAFIDSLYPPTVFPLNNAGKQYTNITKIVAPERGSPQKYFALRGNGGSNINFGSKSFTGTLFSFDDKESLYDPDYVVRPDSDPWGSITDQKIIEEEKQFQISEFISNEINNFGGTPLFSGIIDGGTYIDVGISGGLPKLMIDKGYDYLDFDNFVSGYPGDLFGYSVSLHKNKLVVGSPFTAFSDENINPWLYYYSNNGQSGIELSYNGGAGSVYVFEKTFNGLGPRNIRIPWQFMQKLRPDSINIGQDISDVELASGVIGSHSYSSEYLDHNTKITDQFGYSVSIDSDIIIVGAPGHDFEKYIENVYDSGSFIRKAFNQEFDIPDRNIIDLGNSGVRQVISSGECVLNHGATFTFERRINDWSSRSTKWEFVEKIIPQGINAREQNTNENDYFGRAVYIHKADRSDSNYVIITGAENHSYDQNGQNELLTAGGAYSNDIMLRELPPVRPDAASYIDAKVFGEIGELRDPFVQIITNNNQFDTIYKASGIIYSNIDGAIFLEASGQDISERGFIQHRPFVLSVDGLYYYGIENSGNLPLFIDGTSEKSENINLYTIGTTGNVYNNLGLYTNSIVDFSSGVINFYTDCPDPITVASGLSFSVSGIGIYSDQLNMRIRGF